MGMTKHLTPDTGQMRLTAAIVIYTYSLGAKDTAQSHIKVALRTSLNNQGLRKAGFIVSRGTKRVRCPLVTTGGCDWLV